VCDVVGMERAAGARVVAENESFVAYVPFAARFPYEVHIVSRRHTTTVLDLTSPERTALAGAMKDVLSGYDTLFGFPMPYVMTMHQAAVDDGEVLPVSHLHMEYSPPYRAADRLKYLAGSELGGGAFMNDVRPEEAASALRDAIARAG
jgi:UDPglucose--hexose-1-phosphate uridylyltransferase